MYQKIKLLKVLGIVIPIWDGNLSLSTADLPSEIKVIRAPQTYEYYTNNKNGQGAYPRNAQKLVEDVLLNRKPDATEKLVEYANTLTKDVKQDVADAAWRHESVEERLKHALVKGIVEFIDVDIEKLDKNMLSRFK